MKNICAQKIKDLEKLYFANREQKREILAIFDNESIITF